MDTNLEKRVDDIEQRNIKVTLDKAWEGSSFRIISIMVLTYIFSFLFLYISGGERPFLSSLFPPLAFFLSTRSLIFLRKNWEKKFFS